MGIGWTPTIQIKKANNENFYYVDCMIVLIYLGEYGMFLGFGTRYRQFQNRRAESLFAVQESWISIVRTFE